MNPNPPQDIHVDNVETATLSGAVASTDHAVNDTITVRIVVMALALIAMAIIGGEIFLETTDRTMPESLLVLAGVAVGALGSLLASTASKKQM